MVREMGPRLALKFEHTRFRNDGAGPLRNGSSGIKARDEHDVMAFWLTGLSALEGWSPGKKSRRRSRAAWQRIKIRRGNLSEIAAKMTGLHSLESLSG